MYFNYFINWNTVLPLSKTIFEMKSQMLEISPYILKEQLLFESFLDNVFETLFLIPPAPQYIKYFYFRIFENKRINTWYFMQEKIFSVKRPHLLK